MGLPSATAAVAPRSRRSCLASSSAAASCQQLSHCGDSATPLPGPGHRPDKNIIHEEAVSGRPSPAHMQEFHKRRAALSVIPERVGLSGAGGSPLARPRLLFAAGGGARGACALAAGRLLGNRVREEPILSYKDAGTHNDSCP